MFVLIKLFKLFVFYLWYPYNIIKQKWKYGKNFNGFREGIYLYKCVICICQKSGSLVSTKDGQIKIIEVANIQNDEFYRRLMLLSPDTDFEYHMDKKCYKNYVHKKAFERIKVNFLVDY